MRIAVYAVYMSGAWSIRRSLDMRVDMLWHRQEAERLGGMGRIVLLDGEMAYSLAMKLEQRFAEQPGMKIWDLAKWNQWTDEVLGEGMNGSDRFAAGKPGKLGGQTGRLNREVWTARGRMTSRHGGGSGRQQWIWDLDQEAPEEVYRLWAEPAGAGRMDAALHTASAAEALGRQAALLSSLLR
ncbi:hypothetical protein P9847_07035, partial [Paenibacillus chibensis]|nr:hypothetical protein [Paenibacillus chibensis]